MRNTHLAAEVGRPVRALLWGIPVVIGSNRDTDLTDFSDINPSRPIRGQNRCGDCVIGRPPHLGRRRNYGAAPYFADFVIGAKSDTSGPLQTPFQAPSRLLCLERNDQATNKQIAVAEAVVSTFVSKCSKSHLSSRVLSKLRDEPNWLKIAHYEKN